MWGTANDYSASRKRLSLTGLSAYPRCQCVFRCVCVHSFALAATSAIWSICCARPGRKSENTAIDKPSLKQHDHQTRSVVQWNLDCRTLPLGNHQVSTPTEDAKDSMLSVVPQISNPFAWCWRQSSPITCLFICLWVRISFDCNINAWTNIDIASSLISWCSESVPLQELNGNWACHAQYMHCTCLQSIHSMSALANQNHCNNALIAKLLSFKILT